MILKDLIATKWDSAEYLEREEDIQAYLQACIEEAGDDAAFIAKARDMNILGWNLHLLTGRNPKNQDVEKHYSVSVNGNWRLTFKFENEDAI